MRLPAGTYRTSYADDMSIVGTRLQWILFIIFFVMLFTLPLLINDYVANLFISIAITIVACHGLNLLSGYCGQFSMGHAAFVAIGAYTSCLMTVNLKLPFWVGLPAAGLAAGLAGLLFGFPSLRVRGFYLIMSTLAAQFIVSFVLSANPGGLTGGVFGLTAPAPTLGNIVFNTPKSYYYIVMVTCVLMTLFAKNIARTDIGRAFVAVRDNDIAAEAMGISLYRTKLAAFFIGCFYAGIAGSLWAHYLRAAAPDNFTLMQSVWYLGMIIIGGMGSTLGCILGVIFVRGVEELTILMSGTVGTVLPQVGALGWAAFAQFAFGLVVVLFLVFEPRGLAHRWELLKAYYRLWPFAS